MNHDEITRAVRLSLVATDEMRATHHNVHALRARRQEREAQAVLGYTRGRESRLDNVVPFIKPDEPPPVAA